MRALVICFDGTRDFAHAHGTLAAGGLNPIQNVLARARKIEHHACRFITTHALASQQFTHACNIVVAIVFTRNNKHQGTAAGTLVKTARLIPAAGNQVGRDLLGRVVFARARRGAQKVQAVVVLVLSAVLILGNKQRTLKKLAHRLLTCKIGSKLLVARRQQHRLTVEFPRSHGQTSDLVVACVEYHPVRTKTHARWLRWRRLCRRERERKEREAVGDYSHEASSFSRSHSNASRSSASITARATRIRDTSAASSFTWSGRLLKWS